MEMPWQPSFISYPQLNAFLTERFATVSVEICGEVEKTLTLYQEEISRSKEEIGRLRTLLHIVTQPKITLHRTDARQLTIPEEEDRSGHQHQEQEWSPSPGPDPDPAQIKEETKELMTRQKEKFQGLESDTSILKLSASFVKTNFGQGKDLIGASFVEGASNLKEP
ncbi:hypothetical protein DPEC_G00210090 [Dallia pectoralis]|uniref:Uncharacterized protein n=1 Tax=Dallia pectoralis TaxID=75939 RepID=A0ACC2G644_DALPE|nr:hypothetical protein DPEC_G00210090 [Dallia pectoralis]